MPRSRANGNFIDKTSSIVANILLRIIPTTSGEKKAFTYYRDGAIWLFFFFVFFSPTYTSVFREREGFRIERTVLVKQTHASGRWGELTIPSVVYPRLMRPQMLQLWIWVLSERLHLQDRLWITGQANPTLLVPVGSIGDKSTTPRNRKGINKRKTLLEISPFLIGIGAGKNGWDNKQPSGLYFGYPYNHQRSLKWLIPLNRGRWEQRNSWGYRFLLALIEFIGVKKNLFREGWLEISWKNTSPFRFIMRRD